MSTSNHDIVTNVGRIFYSLSRSPRRKTIAIHVDQDAHVRVLAPRFVAEGEISDFVRQKARWIIDKSEEFHRLGYRRKKYLFRDGEKFLFLGKEYCLRHIISSGRRVKIDFTGSEWRVSIPEGLSSLEIKTKTKKVLVDWYQNQAKEVLAGRIFHFARILEVDPESVTVRTQKRIWGSCHYTDKKIHLNWKIVMAPMDTIDYLVVHELCHLKTPNHSKRFWQRVKSILPDYKSQEDWLKIHSGVMALA